VWKVLAGTTKADEGERRGKKRMMRLVLGEACNCNIQVRKVKQSSSERVLVAKTGPEPVRSSREDE
jgi:hypothetical protein